MKKVLTLALAVASVAAMSLPAAAVTPVEGIENCYYNYICPKSVNEVVPDGIYNESEWAEAPELVINDDTLEDYGRWQTKGEPLPADQYSWTYKFKWDENYFYVLEIRTDAAYISDYEGQDYAGNKVYAGDGTAIFFRDSALIDVDQTNHNICFFPYIAELGTASVYVGGDDETDVPDFFGPSGESNITYGGTMNGNTTVFELKMGWDHMRDQGHLESDIADGTIFRFTPIIMNRDTIEDYNAWGGISDTYRQLNFHDCVRIPTSGQTGVDVHYYAALTLSAGDTEPASGVIEATEGFANEGAENLFDKDENTKWCLRGTAPISVTWKEAAPVNVTGYEIVTANDTEKNPGRNPAAWMLSGSNDGETWTVIDAVEADNVLYGVNFTPFTYAADAAGEYTYFKYEVSAFVDGDTFQISGLNLLSGDVTPSAPVVAEEPVVEEVVEAPAVEEAPVVAPQTFDATIIATVAAVVSLAGYAVSKKH